MISYIALFLFVLGIILLQENHCRIRVSVFGKQYDLIPIIAYLVFLAFYGLRQNIGYDYQMYVATVNGGFADEVYGSKGEILSAALLDFASYMDSSYLFFFLVAAISLAGIVYALHHYAEMESSLGWGLLVFLALPIGLIFTLSIQRQFLAIGFILYGMKYLWERKPWKYAGGTLLAVGSHLSSFNAFLLYFVQTPKLNKKMLVAIGLVGSVLMLWAAEIVSVFLPVYQQYIENSYRDIEGGESQAVLYGIFLVIALLLSRYVKDKVRYEVFLRNYLCGIFFLIWIFPFDPNVAIRFGATGLLSILFMLPMWFSAFSPKDRGLAKVVCVILLAMLYAYNLAVTSGDYYIPYQSVFS